MGWVLRLEESGADGSEGSIDVLEVGPSRLWGSRAPWPGRRRVNLYLQQAQTRPIPDPQQVKRRPAISCSMGRPQSLDGPQTNELLVVLDRPEVPLNTNGSERDLR